MTKTSDLSILLQINVDFNVKYTILAQLSDGTSTGIVMSESQTIYTYFTCQMFGDEVKLQPILHCLLKFDIQLRTLKGIEHSVGLIK